MAPGYRLRFGLDSSINHLQKNLFYLFLATMFHRSYLFIFYFPFPVQRTSFRLLLERINSNVKTFLLSRLFTIYCYDNGGNASQIKVKS